SERAAVLLDRRRTERVGAARSIGLPGSPRRLRVGNAASPGFDRVSRPCCRGGDGWDIRFREEGWGRMRASASCRGVAQPGRALGSGPRGRGVKFTLPDKKRSGLFWTHG